MTYNTPRSRKLGQILRKVPKICEHDPQASSTLEHHHMSNDIARPFPMAAYQRRFLQVAVNYFTKWVEAEPVGSITSKVLERFVWQNIITRFSVPNTIITDNGRQFTSKQLQNFCKEWHIHHKTTSVEHLPTNGQVELANKIIVQGIKKRLDSAKGIWVEELSSVLWAHKTTEQTTTKETHSR